MALLLADSSVVTLGLPDVLAQVVGPARQPAPLELGAVFSPTGHAVR